MTLARTLPNDATGWWFYLGTFVLYAAARWFFAWRQARHEGDEHPVRAAFAEEDDPGTAVTGGFRSYRQFIGFVGSAVVVVLVAGLTAGRLRLALLWTIVPVLIATLAYLDFRLARKARSRAL